MTHSELQYIRDTLKEAAETDDIEYVREELLNALALIEEYL